MALRCWLCPSNRKIPSLKLTFSNLKMDGWNTIVSFWDGLFSGAGKLLVSGSVPDERFFVDVGLGLRQSWMSLT